MKTLFAAIEMPPAFGGVERYYANLVRHWPGELSVIDNGSRGLVNPSLPFLKWLPSLFSIGSMIRESKPDWVIAGEVLPIGTAVWILSHFFTFKYAVILHGLDLSAATAVPHKRWLSRRILARASRIICANSHTGALAQAFSPSSSIHVVNPGVEAPTLVPADSTARLKFNYNLENRFVLVTVSRLVPRKGIDRVLEALALLGPKVPVTYAIIGNGPEREALDAKIESLGLDDRVIILSDADDEKKHVWLEAADAFIMTARDIAGDYEGFGIVYLEANQHGKPVIAGMSGGVGDAVEDGVNGLRVNESDPAAIADAIRRLIDDPELKRRLGEQGKERAEQFTWQRQIKMIHTLLLS